MLLRTLLLALALLLVGCPDNDDDDDTTPPADDDDDMVDDDDTTDDDDMVDDDDTTDDDDSSVEPCETTPAQGFWVCPEGDGFPWAQQLTGTFGAVTTGGLVSFTTTAGEAHPLRFGSPTVANLPDLAAAGQVVLRLDGGCDPKGGAYSQILVRRDADPPLLVLFGGNLQAAGGAGFLVETPRDLDTCPGVDADWCFCWDVCHPKPVTFSLGAAAWTLYQGQSLDTDVGILEVGEVRLQVFEAYSGDGVDCADVGMDQQGWSVVGLEWL